MRSSFSDIDTVTVLAPQAVTATTTSDPVDLSTHNKVTMLFAIGVDAALDGSNFWTLTLTESDTVGSGYTTVAAADVDDGTASPSASILVNAVAEDDTTYKLGYKGNKNFLKAVFTETGTLSGPIGATAILSESRMGELNQASIAIAS